ncbi:MAG: hypothetical protein AB7S68_36695 [Polyangiaceae bacterium]
MESRFVPPRTTAGRFNEQAIENCSVVAAWWQRLNNTVACSLLNVYGPDDKLSPDVGGKAMSVPDIEIGFSTACVFQHVFRESA